MEAVLEDLGLLDQTVDIVSMRTAHALSVFNVATALDTVQTAYAAKAKTGQPTKANRVDVAEVEMCAVAAACARSVLYTTFRFLNILQKTFNPNLFIFPELLWFNVMY